MTSLRLLLLASCLLATNCRKREPQKPELPPPPSAQVSKEDRDKADRRITDLDLSVAVWYEYQGMAAMVMQPFVDFELMEVSNRQKPLEILQERRQTLDSNPRVIDPKYPDLPAALKQWWQEQNEATNALRKAFNETHPENQGRALLDEQEVLLKRIKSERDSHQAVRSSLAVRP